jgi:hypothetical protein
MRIHWTDDWADERLLDLAKDRREPSDPRLRYEFSGHGGIRLVSTLSVGKSDHRRLAYYNLEIRDSYFSRLKAKIESMKKHNGKKVVMCTHSYVPLSPPSAPADV